MCPKLPYLVMTCEWATEMALSKLQKTMWPGPHLRACVYQRESGFFFVEIVKSFREFPSYIFRVEMVNLDRMSTIRSIMEPRLAEHQNIRASKSALDLRQMKHAKLHSAVYTF